MTFETDDNVDTGATENTAVEVETEQTEQEVNQTETQEPEQTQEPKDDEQKPKRNRAQERIEQLARENAELKRWRAEQEAQAAKPKQSESAPRIEEFEDYDDYIKAQTDYLAQQAEERVLSKIKAEQEQKTQIERQVEFETAINEMKEQGVDVDGFEKKINSLPPLPVTLDQFGLSVKDTLSLAHKLLQDDGLYLEISQMNPYQAAMKIGQFIGQQEAKPIAPQTSKAPAPIKPVKANAPASRNTDSMSDEEYMAMRRQQRLKG